MDKLKSISQLDFFSELKEKEIEELSTISNLITYPKNSILYYEDEIKENILFLVDGLIKIYKYDKFENEIFLYHIYKNSMISELTSVNNSSIYCFSNAEFVEDSIVLSINFEKFKEMFLSRNILSIKLIETLLEKTHQLQCIVNRELVFDSTAKVAFMIYNDLAMFNKLKRQEVSFMLHIQPETLSRVLKKLTRNGSIAIEKSEVIVLNKEQLESTFRGVGI
ncbi:transcriptional regulator, Crp/Fnr family [Arcobacter nitrofigilis DSM 7299]|uniref:Transcriptional regulator, Crp/Fnr family n=1 Tax=Arcobacter nitrofigilis (strain ATCC 33309 / DSM 7299 / CCUG 15893 / LMG 7604 / NCTC 12251 / CI) TaxID=572480 RepID=D5V225_ARCNC|nr:Crp/Fnr family transcriptional regulator [Arcobacter nitrofigilis]ADG92258.1 transcriptional regulator, Crp/Fnr family [Arcobacter nitrofigilis DSM 7299]